MDIEVTMSSVSTEIAVRKVNHWISGSALPSTSGRHGIVWNPATGEPQAHVDFASVAEVDHAVAVAAKAFLSWRESALSRRAEILFKLRELIDVNRRQLATLISLEHGKTIPDAMGEVARGLENIEFACGIPHLLKGGFSEQASRGIDVYQIRQPLGVVAGITPFNFPAMVPMWMFANAIACGNTFILKPSEKDPSVTLLIAELCAKAGLPEGVFNVLQGDKLAVDRLIEHPDVKAISFVGSTPVAKAIYEAGTRHGKRVQALGGAKNHMVICPDAVVEPTVNGLIGSGFGAAGQRCMAGSVIVTVGEAHDRVIPTLVAETEKLKVGPGLEEGTDVGPVISCDARDRIAGWVQRAIDDGAELVVDGRDPGGDLEGAFIGPTILDKVGRDDAIISEEVFGPVLTVINVDTLEEAIEVVNASRFGNGVSIFTESASAVRKFRHDVEVGMVGVNIGVAAPVAFFPFSGWKASFLGDLHAHGPDAVEFFTRKKTITSRYFSGGHDSGSYFVER